MAGIFELRFRIRLRWFMIRDRITLVCFRGSGSVISDPKSVTGLNSKDSLSGISIILIFKLPSIHWWVQSKDWQALCQCFFSDRGYWRREDSWRRASLGLVRKENWDEYEWDIMGEATFHRRIFAMGIYLKEMRVGNLMFGFPSNLARCLDMIYQLLMAGNRDQKTSFHCRG